MRKLFVRSDMLIPALMISFSVGSWVGILIAVTSDTEQHLKQCREDRRLLERLAEFGGAK